MTFKTSPELFKALTNPLLSLPSVSLKDRKKFPGVPCIYLLCTLQGKVLYVGRTENLAQRWSSHHCYRMLRSDRISFEEVKIAWVEVGVFDAPNFVQLFNEYELKFIQWYRPPYNLQVAGEVTARINIPESIVARLAAASIVTRKSEHEIIAAGIETILAKIENAATLASASYTTPTNTNFSPPDSLRKLTFQIRDIIYRRLLSKHFALSKQLGDRTPDREVIVEEAIAALLDKMDDGEDLGEAIAHRQRIRQQELESGALINPSSRKKKVS